MLAASGTGPWALVGGVIATEAMNLTLVWAVAGWKPTDAFGAKVGNLVALGRDLTQFNVLSTTGRGTSTISSSAGIGALPRSASMAAPYQLLLLPLQQVTTPLRAGRHRRAQPAARRRKPSSRGLRSNTGEGSDCLHAADDVLFLQCSSSGGTRPRTALAERRADFHAACRGGTRPARVRRR